VLVCFSHGKESGPWGTKISAMAGVVRDRGHVAESVDYQGVPDPVERVAMLVAHCRDRSGPIVLAGSSMGGHVAAAASAQLEVAGLFLLAPAFYMPGYEHLTPTPGTGRIVVVHGWEDDVVPVANGIRWAREFRADLHVYPAGHRLTERLFEINRLLDGFLAHIERETGAASRPD
jgi:predicted esterase